MKRWNFIPNEKEELLIKSALLPAPEALKYWYQFTKNFDINEDKGECLRIYTHIFENLKNSMPKNNEYLKIKGAYKQNWLRSHRMILQAKLLLKSLKLMKIPNVLLKGTSQIAQKMYSPGSRVMSDIDVLVPIDKVILTSKVLEKIGFCSFPFFEEKNTKSVTGWIAAQHSTEFWKPGGIVADIHWRILPVGTFCEDQSLIWKDTIPVEYQGISSNVLAPELQLIHACVHGTRFTNTKPIYWIIDAAYILKKYEKVINWDFIANLTQKSNIALPLKITFDFLKVRMNFEFPDTLNSVIFNKSFSKYDEKLFEWSARYGNLRYENLLSQYLRQKRPYLEFTRDFYCLDNKFQALTPFRSFRKKFGTEFLC